MKGAKGLLALPQGRHIETARRQLLKQYKVASVRDLPIYWVAYSMQIIEDRDYAIYQKFLGHLRETFFRQQAVQAGFALLSRSEERRVGNVGVVSFSSRGFPLLYKKTQ